MYYFLELKNKKYVKFWRMRIILLRIGENVELEEV